MPSGYQLPLPRLFVVYSDRPKTPENLAESRMFFFRLNVPLVEVDIGLLADQVGVAATDTLDLGQGVHDLLLTLNIGVEETQNVLEVRLLA